MQDLPWLQVYSDFKLSGNRETDRERERQTDRQTDTDRQSETDRQTEKETHNRKRQTDRLECSSNSHSNPRVVL